MVLLFFPGVSIRHDGLTWSHPGRRDETCTLLEQIKQAWWDEYVVGIVHGMDVGVFVLLCT